MNSPDGDRQGERVSEKLTKLLWEKVNKSVAGRRERQAADALGRTGTYLPKGMQVYMGVLGRLGPLMGHP